MQKSLETCRGLKKAMTAGKVGSTETGTKKRSNTVSEVTEIEFKSTDRRG